MRRIFFGLLMVPLVACDCSDGGGSGRACTTRADCPGTEICIDALCVARGSMDGGSDTGGSDAGGDTGGNDTGGNDTGGGDTSCGGEAIPFDYRPPNLLLVFDRSCSMRKRLDDTSRFGTGPEDTRTRWNVAREAVLSLIADFETRVFWGLMAFPDPREGCGMPADAEVPPGPGTRTMIEAELVRDQIQPFGLCGPDNSDTRTQPRQTPTLDALTSALALPEMMDPMRESFVLLVTDGGSSCGTDAQLSDLASSMAMMGIPVAVVGFATGADVGTLEAIAASGGLPRPGGSPSYYTAESRADLDAVFDEIAARVVSCDLALATAPPDSSEIFVFVNDAELAESAADGWSYDPTSNTITLNGTTCDELRRGDITRISISFGCMPMACVPQAEICNGLDDDCDDMIDEDCLL